MSKSKKTHLRKSCKNKRRKTMRGGDVPIVNEQVQGSSDEVRLGAVVDPVAVVKQPVAVVNPATSFWAGWFGSDKTTGNAVPAPPAKSWFWGGKRRRHKSKSCKK